MPVSYRFLRRYARCARLPLEMLTLARYVLETSLMDYNVVDQRESKMAAAALLQALLMKGCSWVGSQLLQHVAANLVFNLVHKSLLLHHVIVHTHTRYVVWQWRPTAGA